MHTSGPWRVNLEVIDKLCPQSLSQWLKKKLECKYSDWYPISKNKLKKTLVLIRRGMAHVMVIWGCFQSCLHFMKPMDLFWNMIGVLFLISFSIIFITHMFHCLLLYWLSSPQSKSSHYLRLVSLLRCRRLWFAQTIHTSFLWHIYYDKKNALWYCSQCSRYSRNIWWHAVLFRVFVWISEHIVTSQVGWRWLSLFLEWWGSSSLERVKNNSKKVIIF